MKNVLLSFGILALVLTGCSEDKKTTGTPVSAIQINNQRFYVLDGSVRNENGGFVAESATLASDKMLQGEAYKFELVFTLEDGGSITLLPFGKEKLSGSASVKISRTGNEISAVDAQVPGGEAVSLLQGLANKDATGQIKLTVEAHKHQSETHLFVYPNGATPAEENGAELGTIPADHQTWGLRLNKASLISQNVSEGSEP